MRRMRELVFALDYEPGCTGLQTPSPSIRAASARCRCTPRCCPEQGRRHENVQAGTHLGHRGRLRRLRVRDVCHRGLRCHTTTRGLTEPMTARPYSEGAHPCRASVPTSLRTTWATGCCSRRATRGVTTRGDSFTPATVTWPRSSTSSRRPSGNVLDGDTPYCRHDGVDARSQRDTERSIAGTRGRTPGRRRARLDEHPGKSTAASCRPSTSRGRRSPTGRGSRNRPRLASRRHRRRAAASR